jgi:hypothetical protein
MRGCMAKTWCWANPAALLAEDIDTAKHSHRQFILIAEDQSWDFINVTWAQGCLLFFVDSLIKLQLFANYSTLGKCHWDIAAYLKSLYRSLDVINFSELTISSVACYIRLYLNGPDVWSLSIWWQQWATFQWWLASISEGHMPSILSDPHVVFINKNPWFCYTSIASRILSTCHPFPLWTLSPTCYHGL